jgi:tetratricopeptide (TPR) repeat protein
MDQAIQLFRECATEFESLNKPQLQVNALRWVGISLRDIWHLSEAISVSEQALTLARENNLLAQFRILIWGLGWTSSYQDKHIRAEGFLDEALKFANRQANPQFNMDAYFEKGRCYFRAKDFQKAVEYWLLFEEAMDEEYRLHQNVFQKSLLFWARRIGIYATKNWIAQVLSILTYYIERMLARIAKPNYWFGRLLWRFHWWSHRF